ncbi:MAG: hypothetical protein E7543_06000 [Ruminococcaceae bacterium]|nr:hypothetical protein [Oscillospiraceae bacterium]MBQ9913812.1 DUF5596 domain-containing protein [Clostridia bacterium]
MKNKEPKTKNLLWLGEFSRRIDLPQECLREITGLYKKESRHIDRLSAKKLTAATCGKLLFTERLLKGDRAYTYLLSAVLIKARETHKIYREKGISDEIFYDTMKDITVWSENFRQERGITGIDNLMWIQNHLNCKIFRLGRLQFQPFSFYLPPCVSKEKRKSAGIKLGERVLNVHIPQGEKLLKEECEKSFAMAEEFFRDISYKAFICDSWLLCERNRDFMSEDSNIIRFAEMFEILGSTDNSAQTVERVFGKKESDPRHYPETTSLQRQCKNYILSGGNPGTGFGIIRIKK